MQNTSASVSSADFSASPFPLRSPSIGAGQTSDGNAGRVEGHLCDSPTSPSSCCEPSGGGDARRSSASVSKISSIPAKLGLPSLAAACTHRISSCPPASGDFRPREGVKARGSGASSLTVTLILLPISPSVQASPASPDSDVPAAQGGWSKAFVAWACEAPAEPACPCQPHDRRRPTSPGPEGSHASVDGPLKAAGLDKESLVVRRLDDLSSCAAARSWRFMTTRECESLLRKESGWPGALHRGGCAVLSSSRPCQLCYRHSHQLARPSAIGPCSKFPRGARPDNARPGHRRGAGGQAMPGAGVGKCFARNLRCVRTTRCGRCGLQAPDDTWPRHYHAPSSRQGT